MNSRRQILRAHYTKMLRKAANWAGLVALLSTTLVAMPASAVGAQMGNRNTTPTTLKAGATASYAISYTPSVTNSATAIKAIKIEICDSPLESVSCAASASANTNSNGADAHLATYTSDTGTNCGTNAYAAGTATGPGVTGTSRLYTNATGNTPTSAVQCTLTLGAVVNPSGNNQKYYLRITTYSDTGATSELDFGGTALQTAQDIVVSAQVQESLEFCTGDNTLVATCSTVGSGAISLGTGSNCPILSTSNVCTGVSKMAASTNGQGGYSITYNGTNLTSGSDTITANGSPGAASTPNTRQFGLAITAQTGSGTKVATYDFGSNGSKYVYLVTTPTQIATGTAANGEAIYTVTYAANVDATVKAGAYTATINYVCTGLF